jgi:hypothetical protein
MKRTLFLCCWQGLQHSLASSSLYKLLQLLFQLSREQQPGARVWPNGREFAGRPSEHGSSSLSSSQGSSGGCISCCVGLYEGAAAWQAA